MLRTSRAGYVLRAWGTARRFRSNAVAATTLTDILADVLGGRIAEQTGRQDRAGRAAPGRRGVGADPDQPRRRPQARLRADPGHQGARRRRARARYALRRAGPARTARL